MSAFEVGDKVHMTGVPFVVEVLELGTCTDKDDCWCPDTFRFKDPESGEDDWAHACDFTKVNG